MQITSEAVSTVLDIFHEELIPAQGCTEPIALALVAARTRNILGAIPEQMTIYASGNIIKNVKSVVVPNSGGLVGLEAAAALGALAGDPDKELMVISQTSEEDLQAVQAYLAENRIQVICADNAMKLYIRIEASCGSDIASVEIKHLHTNITRITRNGEELLNRPCNDADFQSSQSNRELLSIELITEIARSVELDRIAPRLEQVIELHTRIAEEGLQGTHGVNIGKCIMKNIEDGLYGDDTRNRCAAYAAAGGDARMGGCPLPVIITSGSGNQGMTASLPVILYCRLNNIDKEKMIRALFFSHMATIHIKTQVGRLSAYCGVICAAAAVSGALVLLSDGDYDEIAAAIGNTLGNISGVICDGAKASCSMKIASGIYAAFDSALLAHHHKVLRGGDGIVGQDIEATIRNIGRLAQLGMEKTDQVILDIMTNH